MKKVYILELTVGLGEPPTLQLKVKGLPSKTLKFFNSLMKQGAPDLSASVSMPDISVSVSVSVTMPGRLGSCSNLASKAGTLNGCDQETKPTCNQNIRIDQTNKYLFFMTLRLSDRIVLIFECPKIQTLLIFRKGV